MQKCSSLCTSVHLSCSSHRLSLNPSDLSYLQYPEYCILHQWTEMQMLVSLAETDLVISDFIRLDYCNSLSYGIADIDLTSVQNQLARLVTMSPPFTSSLSLLRSLHWLPVRFRIRLKINLLTYETLRETQPVYLHSMLATSIPSRSLRSNNDNSL